MGSIRRGLCIMAKQPAVGEVKTRLCPALTQEQAAACGQAMLEDTVLNCRAAGCAEVLLAYLPTDAEGWFAGHFPGMAHWPQKGADLGARIIHVFGEAWKRRYQPCVIVGADSPDLPLEYLHAAFDALHPGPASADLVLGPAEDGGYYLVGLKWPAPELFRGIAWSTEQVLSQTLQRAASLRLTTRLLPFWHDIDTPADLSRLNTTLQSGEMGRCPHTRQVLAHLLPILS